MLKSERKQLPIMIFLMRFLRLLTFSVSALLLALCALAAWLPPRWWTECLLAFSLQGGLALLACSLLLVFSSFYLRRLGFMTIVLIGAMSFSAISILDFVQTQAPWWPIQSNASPTKSGLPPTGVRPLRFLQHNVLKSRKNYDAVVTLLRNQDADLVALEEIGPRGFTILRRDPILKHKYPAFAGSGESGQCLLSRWPIQESRTIIRHGLPLLFARLRTPDGMRLSILVIHPPHPTLPRYLVAQNGIFNDLLMTKERIGHPLLIVGDFNATPFNNNFRHFVQRMDLLEPQQKAGLLPSWPSTLPSLLRLPIDHILHSPDLTVSEQRLLPNTGSDHLPLYTVLYSQR
jgi:endonuclease/exonuclease/phosphatase (EEP) superfamily protein YafD